VPRPLVIANPAAGRGLSAGDIEALLAAVRERVGDVDIAVSARPGHAAELGRGAAAEGRELVVVLGGDGTLHETANGLLADGAPAGPALAVLAVGTGSDFGRSLGLAHDPAVYLDALGSGRRRAVDVGRASFTGADGSPASCYWVNVLSAGVGGLVDRYVAGLPDRIGGRPAYLLATLAALTACRRRRLTCRAVLADGATLERELDGFAVAVCNGHTFGGGMRIAPGALVDDGLFDVVSIERRSRVTLLKDFASVYSGTHLTKRGVGHFVCRRLELGPVGPVRGRRVFPLDVDGEPLGDVPLEVDVVPGALTVLT